MDPAQARASLEGDIRYLQRRVEIVSAKVDVACATGRRPRGLVAGLILGVVGVVGSLGVLVILALQVIARID